MCNKNTETGLAAFLLGAVTGIALGVLFAPAKGTTTRRKLQHWAEENYEDQKDFVLEHADAAREKLSEQVKNVREKISDHMDNAREKIAEGKEKVMKEWHKRKDEIATKFGKEPQEEEK